MSDIELQVGDTLPPVEATLLDAARDARNLTGADVYFVMESASSGEMVVDRAATITDASNGKVRYNWQDGDTDTAGFYEAKFRVVFGAGTDSEETQHFPNDDEIFIEIG